MISKHKSQVVKELVSRRESINHELARNGVRFGVYKDGVYKDQLFPYDPIPRIIESDDFDLLEAGLKQRVDALNAYLRDIYSDKRIIHDGVVPEEFVYTSAGYYPQVNGVTPPGGVFAHIAGEDLVQGEDGRWWVLEDNLRIPSGASYPLFVRDIERHASPRLFRDINLRDNRDYPAMLRASMDFVSCEGLRVVLTPGRYNSAFFEHAYLAEKTGAILAFPEDLEVEENKVFFIDYAGNRHRVGAIYRRLADDFLDPFAFNPDSVIGVPGLLGAYRAGNVAIINAPGNGAADDKAIYYFVPEMIRYYLHEEPILHNAPTYMPMFEKDRREVLDRLGELVIKDVAEAGGYGVVFGSSLSADKLEELAGRIKAEPRRFIAQEVIHFRDLDVVDPDSGEIVPRKADLRAFVVTGKDTRVWYSGLTRYSSIPGKMIVNSSQGGGFKDTWVLGAPAGATGEVGPANGPSAPAASVASVGGQGSASGSASQGANQRQEVTLVSGAMRQPIGHHKVPVTTLKAESLYWLGRYSERVFTTLDRFLPFYDRVLDEDVDAFRPFAKALDLSEDFKDFDGFVEQFLYDANNPNSVRAAMNAAFNNAVVLRPELGTDVMAYIEMALRGIEGASSKASTADDIYSQRDVMDDLLAFWGALENSTVGFQIKSFVFIGKYLERLDLYTRFGVPEEELVPALDKLATYVGLLDYLPMPQCFLDGARWLLGQLPARGYGDRLTSKLGDYVKLFADRGVNLLHEGKGGFPSSLDMDVARP